MSQPSSFPSRTLPNSTYNPLPAGINTPLVQNYFGPSSVSMNVFGQPGNYNVSVSWNAPSVGFGNHPHGFNGGAGVNPWNQPLYNNSTGFQVPPPNGPFIDPGLRGLPDATTVKIGRGGNANTPISIPPSKAPNPPGAPTKLVF